METPDLIRLLVPMEDGEVKYLDHAVSRYDINERHGDIALVEVEEDDPNIEWILQEPNIVQVGYSQPAPERGGPPSDVINQGWNGRRTPNPVQYTDIGRQSRRKPHGVTVLDPTASEVDLVFSEDSDTSIPDHITETLGDDYDLSDGYTQFIDAEFEDGVRFGHYRLYRFPNAGIAVYDWKYISDDFQGTDIGESMTDLHIKWLKESGLSKVFIYSYDWVTDASPLDYTKVERYPYDEEQNVGWFESDL